MPLFGTVSSDPYDLSGFSIPFAVTWPTVPMTSSTINVPADEEFSTAVQNSNVLINVAASYSGAGQTSGWGNNIDIVMDNTATITSACALGSASQIRWTGGSLTAQMTLNGASDILLDNVNIDPNLTASSIEVIATNLTSRLACINCTLNTEGDGTNGWGILVQPRSNGDPAERYVDFIFANCNMGARQYQGCRLQGILRLILVDSYVVGNTNYQQAGIRIYFNSEDIFVSNIINGGHLHFENPNNTLYPNMTDATFDNVNAYHGSTANWAIPNTTTDDTGTVTNSTLRTVLGEGDTTFSSGDLTYGSGNLRADWDGSTITWSEVPGKTQLSDFGADH